MRGRERERGRNETQHLKSFESVHGSDQVSFCEIEGLDLSSDLSDDTLGLCGSISD